MDEQSATVLMADDDPDDCRLAMDAFRAAQLPYPLRFVPDGVALLDYLKRRGAYHEAERHPLPRVILLDLNMPRMDGREALAAIKADDAIRHIPVIVMSTSRAEAENLPRGRFGCDAFIAKPATFGALVELVKSISRRWLDPSGEPVTPGPEGLP